MFTYQFIFSNPEGIEFIFDMVHEKLFSEPEFEKLCTDNLLSYYKQQMIPKIPTDTPYASRTPDSTDFWQFFEKLGFKHADRPTATFAIDPWTGNDNSELEKCFKEMDAFNKNYQILRREQRKQIK